MATFVLKNAYVMINTVDLSDHVESLTLNTTVDAPEDTAMADTSRTRLAGGLEDWNVDIEFHQDFAAAEVDATLDGCLGVSMALKFRPTSGALSATNPEYQGNGIMTAYGPIAGSVGSGAKSGCHFDGNGALVRAVA